MADGILGPVGPEELSRLTTGLGGVAAGMGALFVLWRASRRSQPPVAKLGRLIWRRSQFCRGWLITGDTGSGKTSSGINQLAHQVFQHEPNWGGLCIDEKGVYWETLRAMAAHYQRSHDLIHLEITAGGEAPHRKPMHRFNLTGDRSIPCSTYAKFVVDTATSLGQGGDKGLVLPNGTSLLEPLVRTAYRGVRRQRRRWQRKVDDKDTANRWRQLPQPQQRRTGQPTPSTANPVKDCR